MSLLCGAPHLVEGAQYEHVTVPNVRQDGTTVMLHAGHRYLEPSKPVPMLVDGEPVVCKLDAGHGGFTHEWWHHKTAGHILWHTALGEALGIDVHKNRPWLTRRS